MDNSIRPAGAHYPQPEAAVRPDMKLQQDKLPADLVTFTGSQGSEAPKKAGELPSPVPGEAAPADKAAVPQVLYADWRGQITHLGLQVDGSVTSNKHMGREVFSTIKTLFKEMEPDTKFTIVCDSKSDIKTIKGIMKEIQMPDPERVHLVQAPYDITSWMRDNMVMASIPGDPAHSRMIDKVPFQSHDPSGLPKFIAEQTPELIYMKDPKLRTDGGDVVSDTNKAFVGYDSVYLTAMNLFRQTVYGMTTFNSALLESTPPVLESPHFSKRIVFDDVPAESHLPKYHLEKNPNYSAFSADGINHEKAALVKSAEYFKQRYNKEIVIMGDDDPKTKAEEKPATFHIDMGVTLVDDKTALLGSPRMAMDIIKSWPKEKYDAANASLRKETGMSGDILGYLIDHNSRPDPRDPSVMRIQNNFDGEEKRLREHGKNVIKIPYLEGSRTPWISYGNCLMQDFNRKDGTHVRNVFLPVYGIPLDEVAKKAYEDQGFTVIPLTLSAFTALAGAIRCMSNYFGRSPA